MLNTTLFLIFVAFSFFLRDFLTPLSFILIALSSIRMYSRIHLNQIVINIFCLIIFAYYILTFGKVITPEIGLNFLLNIILLKFMESKKFRDEVMCIWGTILLLSSGALFDKSLSYFIFFTISFFFLLSQFSGMNQVKFFTWKNSKVYLKLSVLVVVLFFIFPRIPNPIPFSLNSKGEGEIGYSPEINISSIEKLFENDAKVFWAKLGEEKKRDDLYWRGNVASVTDGWNWIPGPIDQGILESAGNEVEKGDEYRLFIKTAYLFTYDQSPSILKINNRTYKSDNTDSFSTSYIRNHTRYFVKKPNLPEKDFSDSAPYLKHHLNKESISWINETFKDNSVEGIVQTFKDYIVSEGFRYSWTPGKIESMDEFLKKKIGFCSHYASTLALILRAKNHPARIVSGFQGGRYNPYGNFYEINQNDAHAWVEVRKDGDWLRIDPTSFIAPERINMDYQEIVSNNFIIPQNAQDKGLRFFNEIKFIFGQWDFSFYQFMDQWDSFEQLSYFSQFKLTRKKLLFLSVFFTLIFCILLLKNKKKYNRRQKAWFEFLKILEKQNIKYEGSFEQLRADLLNGQWINKEKSIELLDEFVKLFYADSKNEAVVYKLLKEISR
ncbi:MAG TPA: transglutaminaseTgpA domain-containing protein [Bacteriovoracaceae bacterium]|nr:transglutaminaseTgpA domain-containing protein [Bacteriovoracaceae bacterium]